MKKFMNGFYDCYESLLSWYELMQYPTDKMDANVQSARTTFFDLLG